MSDVLPAYRIEILRRRHTLVLFEHTAEMLRIVKPQIIRGCLITYVKAQVGVFLLKLHIMKREHSGGYVTDE